MQSNSDLQQKLSLAVLFKDSHTDTPLDYQIPMSYGALFLLHFGYYRDRVVSTLGLVTHF